MSIQREIADRQEIQRRLDLYVPLVSALAELMTVLRECQMVPSASPVAPEGTGVRLRAAWQAGLDVLAQAERQES